MMVTPDAWSYFCLLDSVKIIPVKYNAVKIGRPGTGRCTNSTIIVGLSSYVSVSFRMRKR